MKNSFFLAMILLLSIAMNAQNVGINNDNSQPHSSAILDLKSTNKGLLIPRLTSAQRTAISSPAAGLMVFDTDLGSFWFYNGTAWSNVVSSGLTLPYSANTSIFSAAFAIKNDNSISSMAIRGESDAGYGLYGRTQTGTGILGAAFADGIAISGSASSGIGVKAHSGSGIGLQASSTSNSAIFVNHNNSFPAIDITNNNASGLAIQATSVSYHAIEGNTGGTSKAGVAGIATGLGGYGIFGSSTSSAGYGVYGNNASGIGVYAYSNTGTGLKALSASGWALEVNGKLKIYGGNTNPSDGAVLTSDATGNAVWQNNRIAFSAKEVISALGGIADGTSTKVHFQTEEYDYGSDYALMVGTNPVPANSVFTVPVSGIYHFDAKAFMSSSTDDFIWGDIFIKMQRGATTSTIATGIYSINNFFPNSRQVYVMVSKDVKLLVNDKIWIEVQQLNEGESGAHIDHGYFNAHLVFAD